MRWFTRRPTVCLLAAHDDERSRKWLDGVPVCFVVNRRGVKTNCAYYTGWAQHAVVAVPWLQSMTQPQPWWVLWLIAHLEIREDLWCKQHWLWQKTCTDLITLRIAWLMWSIMIKSTGKVARFQWAVKPQICWLRGSKSMQRICIEFFGGKISMNDRNQQPKFFQRQCGTEFWGGS